MLYIHTFITAVAKPSYGELIDMLNAAEREAARSINTHASILLLENLGKSTSTYQLVGQNTSMIQCVGLQHQLGLL